MIKCSLSSYANAAWFTSHGKMCMSNILSRLSERFIKSFLYMFFCIPFYLQWQLTLHALRHESSSSHPVHSFSRCNEWVILPSPIELDWIEEYKWVNPPNLLVAVLGDGLIQKWSHFQLDSLFSPRPCTKEIGKEARWQPPIFVSCLLIGPNGFTPLFRTSSMLLPLGEVEKKIARQIFHIILVLYN